MKEPRVLIGTNTYCGRLWIKGVWDEPLMYGLGDRVQFVRCADPSYSGTQRVLRLLNVGLTEGIIAGVSNTPLGKWNGDLADEDGYIPSYLHVEETVRLYVVAYRLRRKPLLVREEDLSYAPR